MFSDSRGYCLAGAPLTLLKRERRQAATLPKKSVEGALPGSGERIQLHTIAKSCELAFCLAHQLRTRPVVERRASEFEKFAVERREPRHQLLPGLTTDTWGRAARRVQLSRNPVDQGVKRLSDASLGPSIGQSHENSLQVRRKRAGAWHGLAVRIVWAGRCAKEAGGKTDGPAPLIEGVEHIGAAEINLDGAASRAFAVGPFDGAIDTAEGHL